jgi:adenylate kinase
MVGTTDTEGPAMRVTLLGPPGSGKGAQGEALAAVLGVPHVVSSDLLHEAPGGDGGGDSEHAMTEGNLVDDDIVIDAVKNRLAGADAQDGFVLDGFPRTAAQAEALDEWLAERRQQLDAAVLLDVPRQVLLERIRHRAGDEGRVDDDPQTWQHRLDVYDSEVGPLIDHYKRAGKLRRVDGNGTVDEVAARVLRALDFSPREGREVSTQPQSES